MVMNLAAQVQNLTTSTQTPHLVSQPVDLDNLDEEFIMNPRDYHLPIRHPLRTLIRMKILGIVNL